MNKIIFGALSATLALTATACERHIVREPDPTAVLVVNTLVYQYGDLEPARAAYRAVAAERGWSTADIDAFEFFLVDDVIRGESGGCWNVRGGARMTGTGCEISKQGRKSDSGFGQVIRIHYRYPNGWLCKQEGLCSAEDITSNPWDSMVALVALVEHDGKRPWCYSAQARAYHKGCATAPKYKPGPG